MTVGKNRILVIDDDKEICEVLAHFLKPEGFAVRVCTDPLAAFAELQDSYCVGAQPYSLILCDLMMPGMGGLELLRKLKRYYPHVPVILITAHSSVDSAVQSIREGATDYLRKPLDLNELRLAVTRALRVSALEAENQRLKHDLGSQQGLSRLIGRSAPMRRVVDMVLKLARIDSTVLIQGESGTGKELVARAIHEQSSRSKADFVALNCAAIPHELLESELFGHQKGSFTGAVAKKLGIFEAAQGGTLLLDEIGDMPLLLQSKLLRVLQEKQIRPVGENRDIPINVRIIAATHRNLRKEVNEGRFREDLFYRLNVLPIYIPALRERKEDIPLLCEHLIRRIALGQHRDEKRITADALRRLSSSMWPGNVRQLENTLERAMILSDTQDILAEHVVFDQELQACSDQDSYSMMQFPDDKPLEEIERLYISHILERCNGVKEKAAKVLGIDRKTLYRKERQMHEVTDPSSIA